MSELPAALAQLARSPDVRVFLGRLTHLDPGAVVRLRPATGGRTGLWARLPWGVLVSREIAASASGDVTVGAAALLAGGEPAPRDADWRWPLPPGPATLLEEIPVPEVRRVAAAAAGTLREVSQTGLGGKPVGVRLLREALLDHVAIVVEGAPGPVEVPQRLVQAVVRMGFLGDVAAPVRVGQAGRWLGLAAQFGTAWLPPAAGLGLPLHVESGGPVPVRLP